MAHVGQQQVQLNEPDQNDALVGREPHAFGHFGADHHAGFGVVAGEALAQVVEEGADEQQVGPVDSVDEAGGVGASLEQVAVHGEAVVRVALGLVAYGRPLRQVALEEPATVEGLDGGDGRTPGGEHPHQDGPQRVGPGHIRGRGLAGQQVERVPGDGQVVLGRHRGQPEGEGGVPGRIGVVGEDHFRLADGDARFTEEGSVPRTRRLAAAWPYGRTVCGETLRRRQASSHSQAMVRPAAAIDRMNASGSASPRASATASCSWSRSLLSSRPARRCSSTRAAVRTARASSTATVSM